MLTTITALFSVFTSGAGGGLLGGIFGLFKQSQEKKERVEMARIDLERDAAGYANDKEERAHALIMLDKGAKLEVEKIQIESEASIDIENQKSLSSAQKAEFSKLQTSSWIDNVRASVRPVLAYWSMALFTYMLYWAFDEYGSEIDKDLGKQILVGMFSTLTFIATSVTTFYFVSRKNQAPKL